MTPESPFSPVSPSPENSSPPPTDSGIGQFETRSFLSRPPHWLVRSGTTLILCFIVLGLLLAAFIRFPALVIGEATLVGDNPVAPVVARTGGNLTLLRENGDQVEKGDPLGFVGGGGDPELVATLKALLLEDSSTETGLEELPTFDGADDRLGRIHGPYATFGKMHRQWREFEADTFPETRRAALQGQIEKEALQVSSNQRRIAPLEEQRETALAMEERLREALQRGSISRVSFEEQRSVVLGLDRQIEESLGAVTSAQLSLEQAKQTLESFVQEREERGRDLQNELQAAREATLSAIKEWEDTHLLSAPADGSLSLYDFWSDGQHVAAETHVLSVIPEEGSVRAHILVPGEGAGRIKLDQKVILKLADFPSREFGWLIARVTEISSEAREGNYMVVAELEQGLQTHTGHRLTYRSGLSGEGRVVTREMSLLARFLAGLRGFSF